MKPDLKDQLQSVRGSVRTTRKQPGIVATLNEGEKWEADSWIMFEPANGVMPKIVTTMHLFYQLRDAIRWATGDKSWSVRYASQITRENVPFLHCTTSKSIVFDPLSMFRDPVREFHKNRYFLWGIHPSQAHYFKTMEEAALVDQEIKTLDALKKAASGDSVPSGDDNA